MSARVSDLSEAPCRLLQSTHRVALPSPSSGWLHATPLRVVLKLRSVEAAGGAPVLIPENYSLAGEVLSRRVRFSGHETAGGLGGEGDLCGREGRKE